MNPLDPNNVKRYYSVGEVAKLLGVSASLLRFWEKKFPNLKPPRNKQGLRRYTVTHIAYLQKIHQLVKKEGYTLQGAKEVMRQHKQPRQGVTEVINKLKTLKGFLLNLKEDLRRQAK